MSIGGLGLTLLGASLGMALAVSRARPWVIAVVAGATYVVLALWSYLPPWPVSIAMSVYGSVFFVEALPSRSWLGAQLLWALAVAGVLVARRGRLVSRRTAASALLLALATVTVAGATVPYPSGREGRIALSCTEVSMTRLCLWQDLSGSRHAYDHQVRAAERIVGPDLMPRLLVSRDLHGGLPRIASPVEGEVVVGLPVTLHPRPREIIGLVVGSSILIPPACADLAFAGLPGPRVPDVVAEVVESGLPTGDSALTRWVSAVREDAARCRPPALP